VLDTVPISLRARGLIFLKQEGKRRWQTKGKTKNRMPGAIGQELGQQRGGDQTAGINKK